MMQLNPLTFDQAYNQTDQSNMKVLFTAENLPTILNKIHNKWNNYALYAINGQFKL